MSAQFVHLPRPEDGEFQDCYLFRHHNCALGKSLRRELDDEDIDLLLFPVGIYGSGMPLYTAFEVLSSEPCGACETTLRIWAEWVGPKVVSLG